MIDISTTIAADLSEVWVKWNDVKSVQFWSFASDTWGAEGIENDLRVGGKCSSRNFAKDGSSEFIFGWTYNTVEPEKLIDSTMDDGRKIRVVFTEVEGGTRVDESFDPETENSEELQREGWQAYLDNFKKFVEMGK